MKAGHKSSWGRRVALSVLVLPLVLVGLVLAAVLFIIATPWGSHLALARALETYSQMIPGEIEVENISGTILFGPRFEQVAIIDRNGDKTVTAAELDLGIDPLALVRGSVQVESLIIRDGQVYLRNIDGNSSFVDVAPTDDDPADEPDPAPEQEDLPAAPELPFDLMVKQLEITNTTLFSVPDENPDAPDTIAHVEKLRLYGRWLGGDASAHITEIKGAVPPAGISVTEANLGATLEAARFSYLNDGHIVTNRGTVQLKAAAYDIAATEGQAQLGVKTNSDQLKDLVPALQANRSISLDLQLAMLSDVVELFGLGHAGNANLELQGAIGFVPSLYGNLKFDLQRIRGALFSAGVQAELNGTGKARFLTAPNGTVNGVTAFSGQINTTSPLGKVAVDMEANRSGGSLEATAHGQSDHGRLSVRAKLTPDNGLALNWKARITNLSPFAQALSLPDTTGSLFTSGSCKGTVDAPKCTTWLDVNHFATAGTTLKTLKGKGVLSLRKDRFSAEGRAELQELMVAGWSLREATLRVTDTDTGFDLVIDAVETEEKRADLVAQVVVGTPTTIHITQVQSQLADIAMTLESPMEIQLGKRSVSIAGGPLLIGEAKLWLRGDASLRGVQNLTMKLQGLDLSLVSRLTGGPVVDGLLDGDAQITGTATRPRLELSFRSGPLTVDGKSLAPIEFTGNLQNNLAKATVRVGSAADPLASLNLAVPLRVDLQRSRFIWLKTRPHTISWDIADLNDNQVADWLPDDTIVFDLTTNGRLTFSTNAAEGHASLHGSMGYEDSNRDPFSGSAQFSSTTQKISLEFPGLDGNPLLAEMDLKISIPELLQNRFDMGPSRIIAKMGKSSLNAEAIHHGASHFDIRGAFSEIDLSYFNYFFNDPALTLGGVGSGSGSVAFLKEKADIQVVADVKALTISDQTFGDLHLDTRWQSNELTVQLNLQDETRYILDLTAKVPLLQDPKPNQNRWQPNKNHSIKWSINRFELANLSLVLGLPTEFVGEVSGEGVVSGVLDELYGYANLNASARYGDLPPLDMVVNGEFQSKWQQVKVNLITAQEQIGLLDIRYSGNLGKIVRGQQLADQAPIALRFKANRFSLKQLNPFMPPGLYDIAGAASAHIGVTGTLADPTVQGKVVLEETEVAVSGIYQPFTNINATLKFSDKDFLVDDFQFNSGQGTATANVKGTITAWNKYTVNSNLKSKKLALGLSGLPPMKIDTEIAVDLNRTSGAMNVDARIGKTVLELADWIRTMVEPAPTNANVVLVEHAEEASTETKRTGTSVEVRVTNSTPLRLTGSLLDTTWDVDMNITSGAEPTRIDGKATVVKGSFEILGNSFNVEEADLIFDQAAEGEPFLNMIATTDFPGTQVKATIRGRVSNPELTLTSIPSMNEADIYSLLLVGTTDMDSEGGQSANLLMGVASMKAPIMKQALRKAGITQFSVGDAQAGEGQVMTIGARLSPDLVMQITVNLNAKEGENESELRFVYDISRQWKFETGIGPAYSSIDVFWHVPLPAQASKKRPAPAEEAKPD